MKYLLDTHAIIWAVTDPSRLSTAALLVLENPDHQILVSPISFWEISLKYALGKLSLHNVTPEDFPAACAAMDFDILPLEPKITSTLHNLRATYHKDPFDRMLIWQALCLDIPLVSKDLEIALYRSEGLKVVW
ncbi:MAG: type II toxin-antitoxin system VapC family toxin [Saprospiraceae bacterium]